jgi:hypothetical protein
MPSSGIAKANWLSFPLKSQADWTTWFSTMRQQAKTWHIWEYIDPDLPDEEISQPPTVPSLLMPSSIRSTTKSIIDLKGDEITQYSMIVREYDRLNEISRIYERSMDRMRQGIRNSVSNDYKRLINSLTVRETILTLRRMFAPTDTSRRRQIA